MKRAREREREKEKKRNKMIKKQNHAYHSCNNTILTNKKNAVKYFKESKQQILINTK